MAVAIEKKAEDEWRKSVEVRDMCLRSAYAYVQGCFFRCGCYRVRLALTTEFAKGCIE